MEPSGVLIVNKHEGVTSHDIVNKIRRLFSTRRVGHTGTLDPLATGVLVMLVGRAAKAAEYLSGDRKGYRATLKLGLTTDTEDITGNILSESNDIPSPNTVFDTIASFVGDIKQIPPMYSALKVDGKKLCDLARQGVTVERQARDITVYSIDAEILSTSEYRLDVDCSSGTYIRTLCADIGATLGCGAVMSKLERTRAGNFDIKNAITVNELEEMSEEERVSRLLPIESLFSSLPSVNLPSFFEHLSRNGCEIYQKKIHTSFDVGKRVALFSETGKFYALGEVRDYPDGTAIKTIKLFEI